MRIKIILSFMTNKVVKIFSYMRPMANINLKHPVCSMLRGEFLQWTHLFQNCGMCYKTKRFLDIKLILCAFEALW